MKAVIMAGGEGKRLKSVTGELPKPMVPLLGKPVMAYIVELLRRNGITQICAALKYNPQPIMDYFGDGSNFGVSMEYRIEKEAMGTAGGVKNCADFYGNEDFLVISGDAACDFDIRSFISAHEQKRGAAAIALHRCSQPLGYGLAVTDEDGLVRTFIEKPGWERVVTDLVNTGIYILSPRVMRYVPDGAAYDFAKDLFPLILDLGEDILGVAMEGYWCDIGTPQSYYQCCADALSGKLALPGADIPAPAPQPVSAGEDALPDEHISEVVCRDRAKLMGELSRRLMDMGADYSHGVTVRGRDFSVNFSPVADRTAVRVAVSSGDAEMARELSVAAEDLLKAINL